MKKSDVFEIFEESKGKKTLLYTKDLLSQEYKEFDPYHSKLATAIIKGSKNVGIRKNDVVLYLGASHGYTPSHVSDMVGKNGFVFALDFAPRVVRDLYFLCEKRSNMTPLLEDANHPENYKDKIIQADIIYQDIAQKNQVEIFLKNTKLFLKKGGYALLALKARSIDVTKKPKIIFREVYTELEKHIKVIDYKLLDPFEKDHAFFVCKN